MNYWFVQCSILHGRLEKKIGQAQQVVGNHLIEMTGLKCLDSLKSLEIRKRAQIGRNCLMLQNNLNHSIHKTHQSKYVESSIVLHLDQNRKNPHSSLKGCAWLDDMGYPAGWTEVDLGVELIHARGD